ncbi:MAG: FAD:protein FMN transferase [Ktedonobacteraceae bacterium]
MVSDQALPQASPYPGLRHPDRFSVPADMRRAEFRAMGTSISLLLPEAQFCTGVEVTQDLFAEWEQTLSRFLPESELSHLNRQAGASVHVGPLLFRVLTAACRAAQETEGLFDPTLLTQLVGIGYDRTFDELPTIVPTSEQVPQPGGGWRGVRLDHRRRRVTLPAGIGVDVGGIAKGMAVDASLAQLRLLGVQTALVNAGGDLAVMGLPAEQEHWPLSITGKDVSWIIPFQYGALATSGVDRRHWQQGTLTRHHIVDPRSGASAQSGLWSVTVAAASCQHAEVAAKAAFLLGAEQGRAFLNAHGLSGILVRVDGSWTSAGSWPVALMKTLEEKR